MSPTVALIHPDPIPLAVVRRRAKQSELGTVVPQACGTVWQSLKAQGLKGGRNVAVYLNGNIDVEVGVEMPVGFQPQSDVVRSATPAGPAVTATHFGPYQSLGAAHGAIRDWCKANGYKPTGVNWELYGHWQSAWDKNPSLIRTDVFWQVVPASGR